MKKTNPVITCKDGFTISVQARDSAYCLPREDYPDTPYTHVECGYPSSTPTTKALRELSEAVQAEFDAHGGIVEGCMPSNEPTKVELIDSYFHNYSD